MVEKKIQCPNCNEIITAVGGPGDIVSIICPSCRTEGKFIFKKTDILENAAVEVSNLRKIYGDLVAVNDISFSVKKGEVFAFLGPNGAGKTTTVEMIESIRK